MAYKTFKKYAKALVIPASIYSLLSFLPANAEPVKESVKQDTIQFSALELKTQYETDLYQANKDQKLTSPEIEKLHNRITNYIEAKRTEGTKTEPTEAIVNLETYKDAPKPKKIIKNESLDSITREFEQEILIYYPNLIIQNQQTPLKYDAFKSITEQETFRKLIERSYNLTKDETLKRLLSKETYEVRDVIVFSRLLKSATDNSSIELKKEQDPKVLIDNPFIKKLVLSDTELRFIQATYKEYLDARDKEFAKADRYWSAGVDMWTEKYVGVKSFFTKEIVEDLKKASNLQGYGYVDVAGFYEGVGFKGRIPQIPNWLKLIFGIGFPAIRSCILLPFLLKRDCDALDGVGVLFNGVLSILLDTLHPLVYPIRLFATPFVFEPLRKIFDVYDVS